jgi:hypothetical protein
VSFSFSPLSPCVCHRLVMVRVKASLCIPSALTCSWLWHWFALPQEEKMDKSHHEQVLVPPLPTVSSPHAPTGILRTHRMQKSRQQDSTDGPSENVRGDIHIAKGHSDPHWVCARRLGAAVYAFGKTFTFSGLRQLAAPLSGFLCPLYCDWCLFLR